MNPTSTISKQIPRYNVIIIGNQGVGKSSLLQRLVADEFSEHYIPSKISVGDKTPPWGLLPVTLQNGEKVELEIIDFPDLLTPSGAGNEIEQFRNVPHGVLLVYDVTDEESFNKIPQWMQVLNEKCGIDGVDGVPNSSEPQSFPKKIVVGNKVDALTQKDACIGFEQAQSWLRQTYNLHLLETSAKWNLNVEDSFKLLAQEIHREMYQVKKGGGTTGSGLSSTGSASQQRVTIAPTNEVMGYVNPGAQSFVATEYYPYDPAIKGQNQGQDNNGPGSGMIINTEVITDTIHAGVYPETVAIASNKKAGLCPGFNQGKVSSLAKYNRIRSSFVESNLLHDRPALFPPPRPKTPEPKGPTYLDFNGTTPIDDEVLQEMGPYYTKFWGNPSSSHQYGLDAKKGMHQARARVGQLISAQDPSEIIFMSNGTETINHTFYGCFKNHRKTGHVITQQSEHVAVLETCKGLEEWGCRVTYLPVNAKGLVNVADLESCLQQNPDTFLVSIMHSNNETGCLQQVGEIGDIIRRHNASRYLNHALERDSNTGKNNNIASLWKRAGIPEPAKLAKKARDRKSSPERRPKYLLDQDAKACGQSAMRGWSPDRNMNYTRLPRDKIYKHEFTHCFFHVDASQSLGKVQLNVQDLNIDYLTIAGHKLYAPKGVGALYVRETVDIIGMVTTLLKQIDSALATNNSSDSIAANAQMTTEVKKTVLDLLERSLNESVATLAQEESKIGAPTNSLFPNMDTKLMNKKMTTFRIVNPVTQLPHFLRGAGQENGLRASTENVPYCVALGKACEIAYNNLRQYPEGYDMKLYRLRNMFENYLLDAAKNGKIFIRINAGEPNTISDTYDAGNTGSGLSPSEGKICRLPNTCSVSFYQVEANTLLSEMHDDIAASAGAACHSDKVDISHVLESMQVPKAWAMGTVRFSLGKYSDQEDVMIAAQKVVNVVSNLQANITPPAEQLITGASAATIVPESQSLIPGLEQKEVQAINSTYQASTAAAGEDLNQQAQANFVESTEANIGDSETSGLKTVTDISNIKLTQFTHGLGCACKLRPQALERVLAQLKAQNYSDPRVLVGLNASSDDACVYQIPNSDAALIGTLDFFTPVVDNPFEFGEIAAANALSDVYAMGGKPLFALNIVGFPSGRLPEGVLSQILDGGRSKCTEAGIAICGGHSVEDLEPKYGLSVTGYVEHYSKAWKNNTASSGDLLFLTKKIGTGILSTALKRGALTDPKTKLALVDNMRTLNKYGVEMARDLENQGVICVTAATDVTGFGLLGHLREMLVDDTSSSGSGTGIYRLAAEIEFSKVPFLPEVEAFASQGYIPGGTENNIANLGTIVSNASNISKKKVTLLADATTSGGMLMGIRLVNEAEFAQSCDGKDFIEELEKSLGAKCIGRFTELEDPGKVIRVI